MNMKSSSFVPWLEHVGNSTKKKKKKLIQAITGHRSSSRSSSWSHSLTLGRLYAWEKKLYDEVKAGGSTQKIYKRKCSQLRNKDMRREVNWCSKCKRKLGLIGFRYRCGKMFCSNHRYSDRHECRFDYKAAGRAMIAKENPVVKPARILKVWSMVSVCLDGKWV